MWPKSDRPLVILAPMDGYTEPSFRRFVKQVAPDCVVVSEFLSATNVARKPPLAKALFRTYPDEQPVVIQLYGKDAGHFREAALLAEAEGAAGIDINMGCPAKKVVAHRHGSALMKEIDLACNIIAQVKEAVSVPVSVKTRLGWEDDANLIPFALRLQDVGLDAITIHGRTYRQKFEGEADWEPIYALKRELSIPVFGNGDINSAEKARSSLNNLDGVMVGRGAVDDPWLLRRICDLFEKGRADAEAPPFACRAEAWKTFATRAVSTRGEIHACRWFRKFLVRLVRELQLDGELKRRAVRVETLSEIHRVLDLFADATG